MNFDHKPTCTQTPQSALDHVILAAIELTYQQICLIVHTPSADEDRLI